MKISAEDLEDRMKKTRIAVLILLATVAAAVIIGPAITSAIASPQENEAELEEFVPSEELPPDSAVAFPVDI